jgi:hypothetical protein
LWDDILNILIRVNASASAAHTPIQRQEMPVATADVPDHAVDQRWSQVRAHIADRRIASLTEVIAYSTRSTTRHQSRNLFPANINYGARQSGVREGTDHEGIYYCRRDLLALIAPASAQLTSEQQKMKDCNAGKRHDRRCSQAVHEFLCKRGRDESAALR